MAKKSKAAKPAVKQTAKRNKLKDLQAKNAKDVKGGRAVLRKKTY